MASFPVRPVARGFTLIEMVVVLAIIVVITGVVISGQSSYNQSLLLTDTAYTVAYSVRQAQSLGLASRTAGGVSDAGYGVHLSAPSTDYLLFADTAGTGSGALCPPGTAGVPSGSPEQRAGNCRYNVSGTDQIVQSYTFSRGFTVDDLCVKNSGSLSCTPTELDIVFRRPDTRAIITDQSGATYACAEIHVRAPSAGAVRVVRVSQLGEISVGTSCP